MSKWHEVTKEDLSYSMDKKDLTILFDSDDSGNIWLTVPVKDVLEFLKEGAIKDLKELVPLINKAINKLE
jgi:hypothetical protein